MNPYALILAADLPDPKEVSLLVKQVADAIDGVKIGLTTVLQAGLGFISEISETIPGKPIFLDLKIADIGHRSDAGWEGTNAKIVRSLQNTGVTIFTVHGFPGPVSLAEAVAIAHEVGISVLTLPIMSHAGADLFFSQNVSCRDLAKKAVDSGMEVPPELWEDVLLVRDALLVLGEVIGVDGYIGPATNPEALAAIRSKTKKPIWCPGFGRQDRLGRDLTAQFQEWARIVGSESAAIVGSLIFASQDPLVQAVRIKETIDKVVRSVTSQ